MAFFYTHDPFFTRPYSTSLFRDPFFSTPFFSRAALFPEPLYVLEKTFAPSGKHECENCSDKDDSAVEPTPEAAVMAPEVPTDEKGKEKEASAEEKDVKEVAEIQPKANLFSFFAPSAFSVSNVDDHLVVNAQLGAVDPKTVNITVEDNVLSISGEKKEEKKNDKGEVVSSFYESFHRRVPLPRGVDESKIEATFDNGALNIKVPIPAEARPKRITINSATTA